MTVIVIRDTKKIYIKFNEESYVRVKGLVLD